MPKWLPQLRKTKDQSPESPTDSVRSIIDRAVRDAEQVSASLKAKARREAEAEAGRIIDEAKHRADEIKRRAEAVSRPEKTTPAAEPAKSEADTGAKAEEREEPGEIKRARQSQTVTARLVELVTRKKAKPEPAAPRAQAVPQEAPPQATPAEPKPAPSLNEMDGSIMYNGEIELAIAAPVDAAAVSKLYAYLQATQGVKILYSRGSLGQGTSITVTLDKALPLIGIITTFSGLSVTTASPPGSNLAKGTSGSKPGNKRKEATKVELAVKAGNSG